MDGKRLWLAVSTRPSALITSGAGVRSTQQHPVQHLELDVHGLKNGSMLGEAALGASNVLLPLWERHEQHRVPAQACGGTRGAALSERAADACQPSPEHEQQVQLSALQREPQHASAA